MPKAKKKSAEKRYQEFRLKGLSEGQARMAAGLPAIDEERKRKAKNRDRRMTGDTGKGRNGRRPKATPNPFALAQT